MAIAAARRRCPGIARVPQQPDLYTRIHHRIVAAVLDVLPIEAVCSIDEFAATVAPRDIPAALTHQITQRLRDAVGECVTCSIGYAPNRWLAKIAADLDKPDGLTVLHPRELPVSKAQRDIRRKRQVLVTILGEVLAPRGISHPHIEGRIDSGRDIPVGEVAAEAVELLDDEHVARPELAHAAALVHEYGATFRGNRPD